MAEDYDYYVNNDIKKCKRKRNDEIIPPNNKQKKKKKKLENIDNDIYEVLFLVLLYILLF
jgi:hypothetical protein